MSRGLKHAADLLVVICLCASGCSAQSVVVLHPVKMLVSRSQYRPLPSPNGKQLALVGGNSLLVVDVADGTVATLVAATHETALADWSPDGEWIVYTTNKPASAPAYTPNVRLVRLKDKSVKTLGYGGLWAWSPDCKRIAWVGFENRKSYLTVSDVAIGAQISRNQVQLKELNAPAVGTKPPEPVDPERPETWRGPGWASVSPNGKMLVCYEDARGLSFALGFYGLNGTIRKVRLPGFGPDPIWYPDSKKFLWLSGPSGASMAGNTLRVISAEGVQTPVQIEQKGHIRHLQLLDPKRNLVVYCYSPDNVNGPFEIWIGELRGLD